MYIYFMKIAYTITNDTLTFSSLRFGIFKQVEDLEELEDALNFEIFFAIVFLVIVMLDSST